MSTTTASPASKREAAIAAFTDEAQQAETARSKGDKKSAASHGAKMANRSREIREAELDMAIEGVEFTPWEKPTVSRSRQTPLSQEQIEDSLSKIAAVYNSTDMETVKHSADVRITGLLKAASKRGYTVKDPRKS